MNPFQVKVFMMENGLTVASIARDLCEDYTDVKFKSMQTTISDLIHGRRWFPGYAKELDERYGINIEKPKRKANREIICDAA